MTIALRYTVRSDVGLLREGNEDAAYAGPHLLAIADGMGGHAAGEVASAVAIKTLAPLDAAIEGDDMLPALGTAIADASSALRQITEDDPATEGMGTTVTALLWSGDEVALCHIGDSRAYLLRDGTLEQITHDHTLVQSLVDEGRLTPEAAASHPSRSLVMRALQSSIPADPDLAMLKAQVGDRFLLCSDGLTDVVSDETLQTTLRELTDLDAAVEQLVDLAIRSGGPDNITCVLADVIDTDAGQTPSGQIIIVGALVTDGPEGSEPTRSDNPAARAHLLAQSAQQSNGHANSEPDPPGGAVAYAEPDDEDEEDGLGAGRRRWPVVTCVLMLLVGVVGAAGYYGWRLTQNQYYVGTADGRVVVFRGLSQAIAGVSLSTVVQRTNIPLSALPASEVGYIKSTIGPESNLRQAQRIISQFRHDYRCAVAAADITNWVAHRPKPAPSPHKPAAGKHRPARATAHPSTGKNTATHKNTTTTSHRAARTASHTTPRPAAKQVKYPPKPVMPQYCPAYPGAAG
jgi:serine/threonine protein phosphatase PrpC